MVPSTVTDATSRAVVGYGGKARRGRFPCPIREDAHLGDCLDEIQLEGVERQATPRPLMKLGIRPRLAILSLSNTVYILDRYGVIEFDQPLTMGYTESSYSSEMADRRVT